MPKNLRVFLIVVILPLSLFSISILLHWRSPNSISGNAPTGTQVLWCHNRISTFDGLVASFCYPPKLGIPHEQQKLSHQEGGAFQNVVNVSFAGTGNELLLSILPLNFPLPEVTDAPPIVSWSCLRANASTSANVNLRECFWGSNWTQISSITTSAPGSNPIIRAKFSSDESGTDSPKSHYFQLFPQHNIHLIANTNQEETALIILNTLRLK